MIETLVGGVATDRVFPHSFRFGEGYTGDIAQRLVVFAPVQKQVAKFESVDIFCSVFPYVVEGATDE